MIGRAPISPVSRDNRVEGRCRQDHGIAALSAGHGRTIALPLSRRRPRSSGRDAGSSRRGMSASITSTTVGSPRGRRPARPQARGHARSQSRALIHEFGHRGLQSAGDNTDARIGRRTTTHRSAGGGHRLDRAPDQRHAVELGQQLVLSRCRHAAGTAGSQHQGSRPRSPGSRRLPEPRRGASESPVGESPTPSPVRFRRSSVSPARSLFNTQSKPFSLGLRAQPGAPITGLPSTRPSTSRLPGSTGSPTCSTKPPAARIAAGMTSSASATAEAPNTTSMSWSGASA